MDILKECKIPLMWNANGFVEIIRQDDVSQDEAEKLIKYLECNIAPDSGILFRPSSPSSTDFSSESDSQEKLENIEDCCEIDYLQREKSFNNYHMKSERESGNLMVKSKNEIINKEDKTHVCDLCGKRFSRKFNLNTHIKCVHSDEKDYVCSYCRRAFNHSSNLRKHIKTVHGTEKRLPCPLCKKLFKHPDALKNHAKVIHGLENGTDM